MGSSASAVTDKVQERASGASRPVYRYDVPRKLAKISGIEKVGLVQLTPDEELMGTKRARNDQARLAFEWAKQSLVEVNGKPVSLADGTSDKAWNDMHPKVRGLVVVAYGELHTPEEDEITDFLGSQTTTIG